VIDSTKNIKPVLPRAAGSQYIGGVRPASTSELGHIGVADRRFDRYDFFIEGRA
jgi:hypothetical protein